MRNRLPFVLFSLYFLISTTCLGISGYYREKWKSLTYELHDMLDTSLKQTGKCLEEAKKTTDGLEYCIDKLDQCVVFMKKPIGI